MIRGHNIMKGYWNRPEATEEAITDDGWFHSGDMARVDEDGYYFIVDRKKELIIRGGYNVYPREEEEVLSRGAGGGGDRRDRRRPRRGGRGGSGAEGGERIEAEEPLPRSSWPPTSTRASWFLDELPKGPTGKILKARSRRPRRSARVAAKRSPAAGLVTRGRHEAPPPHRSDLPR